MIERLQQWWCNRFHERCHRHMGCSVICGACGRIWPMQDVARTHYNPSLWFSSEMIAHVGSDRMERFLESRADN